MDKCCNHDDDFTLIDFDEIKQEIAELKEIIQQQKREQERIKYEQRDIQMRLDILHTQIKSIK